MLVHASRGNIRRGVSHVLGRYPDPYPKFIATTGEGMMVLSQDGIDWQYHPAPRLFPESASSTGFGQVGYGDGFWLITRDEYTYIRSEDGISWTQHNWPTGFYCGSTRQSSIRFAYGEGKIAIALSTVTSGSGNMTFCSTTDGINWTTSLITASSTTYYNHQLAYGDGIWMFTHNNTANTSTSTVWGRTSSDGGASWGTDTGPALRQKLPPHYINGFWFYGSMGANYYRGTTAQIVSASRYGQAIANPSGTSYYNIGRFISGNDKIVTIPDAVNYSSSSATTGLWDRAFVSSDIGLTWVAHTVPYLSSTHPGTDNYESYNNGGSNKISGAFGEGVFVFGSRFTGSTDFNGHATYGGLVYSNDDGVNWTRANLKGYQFTTVNPNICDIASTYRP